MKKSMKKAIMHKLLIVFILGISLAGMTRANTLNLNLTRINGSFVKQGDTTYRILDDTRISLNTGNGYYEYRRLIIENYSAIKNMEQQIIKTANEINLSENEIKGIEAKFKDLNETYDNLVNANQTVDEQIHYYEREINQKTEKLVSLQEELTRIQEDIKKVEKTNLNLAENNQKMQNRLTGNVVVSTSLFRIGIVILALFTITAAFLKGKELVHLKKIKK